MCHDKESSGGWGGGVFSDAQLKAGVRPDITFIIKQQKFSGFEPVLISFRGDLGDEKHVFFFLSLSVDFCQYSVLFAITCIACEEEICYFEVRKTFLHHTIHFPRKKSKMLRVQVDC